MSNKNEILPDSQEKSRERFTLLPEKAIKELPANEFRVYCMILMYAYGDNPCTLKNDTIAEAFGVSASTIKRSLTKLHEMGYVKIVYRNNGSVYILREIFPRVRVAVKTQYEEPKNQADFSPPGSPMLPAGVTRELGAGVTGDPVNNIKINNNKRGRGAKAPRPEYREVTVETVNNLLKLDKEYATVTEQDIQEAIDYWKSVDWTRQNGMKIPEKMRIKQAVASSIKNMRMRLQRTAKNTVSQYKPLGSDQ